jgi:hypothetical protein
LKLHNALITKNRLFEIGFSVRLEHQEECPNHSHWCIKTDIPYRSRSWPRRDANGVVTHWSYGVTYKEWKETFRNNNDVVKFLKRYYRHYINFWDWEQLEVHMDDFLAALREVEVT